MSDEDAVPVAEAAKEAIPTPSNKIDSAIPSVEDHDAVLPANKDDSVAIQVSREMFLTRVYRTRNELLLAAKKVNLSIARSQKARHRVSFYPKSMQKVGNTVCTFSAPKRTGTHLWSRTGPLDETLEKWNAVTKTKTDKKVDPPAHAPSIPMLLEVGRAATKRGLPAFLNLVTWCKCDCCISSLYILKTGCFVFIAMPLSNAIHLHCQNSYQRNANGMQKEPPTCHLIP